jgi:hypothetical protein
VRKVTDSLFDHVRILHIYDSCKCHKCSIHMYVTSSQEIKICVCLFHKCHKRVLLYLDSVLRIGNVIYYICDDISILNACGSL